MWPKTQFPVDLVTFTEEILDGKLNFLCNVEKCFEVLLELNRLEATLKIDRLSLNRKNNENLSIR